MNYTEEIQKHLKTELEPSNDKYLCYNTGGVEVEVGEFLYSLVRVIKPKRVLETGTHKGISAAYMAGGLKDNKDQGSNGTLTTIEFLEENYRDSTKLFAKLGLETYIDAVQQDVTDYKTDDQFGIVFLDTEPQTRFSEMVKFYDNVTPGGLIIIHDLHRHMHQVENEEHGFGWPYGPLPKKIEDLVADHKLLPLHLDTPRGITVLYKVHKDDYFYGGKDGK